MSLKMYKSTRGKQEPITFEKAILQGIGNDGGLLVPDFIIEKINIQDVIDLSYASLSSEIISRFVDKKDDMLELCNKAYASGLFLDDVVPVKKVGDVYIAELFQGPTAAFKDMALSLLPHFMTYSLKRLGEERDILILAATSGDTGKAALEGFKNVENTKIQVFYPVDGVSLIQKQQMITQDGNNVNVTAIKGNFDDAQAAVKKAFQSEELKALCEQNNIFLSSANSINIGRLIPQIIYYFYSYIQLVKQSAIELGEEVNFTIPSGNFGNCLAGYLAKQMGLPIKQFIVASNKNNILTDFFKTGKYDIRREFYKTNAPAMDILISSNLERLVYYFTHNSEKVNEYMELLKEKGVYQIDDEVLSLIQKEFKADYLSEEEILKTIKDCYQENHYVLDTHTAIGYGVYKKYQETLNQTKTIILSTASPYKFPQSVYHALTNKILDDYDAIEALEEYTKLPISKPLKGIKDRKKLHHDVILKEDIINYIGQKIKE